MDALIVTNSDKTFSQIAEVVRSSGDINVVRANGGASARRIFSEREFDLIIIGALSDERGNIVARFLAESRAVGVILLEDEFVYEEVAAELEGDGVIVIPRPVHRPILAMAVKVVLATNARINNLKRQNRNLVKEIEDMRLVNRAKYALIESLGYSENQAHRLIEKRAMDERKTKREVALEILKTYDI